MEKTSITIKRVGGYVVVISLLLLGSVMSVWWALGAQMDSRANYSPALVNYSGTGLDSFTETTSETYVITSEEIANGTISTQDISKGGITKDNLDDSLLGWVEGLAGGLANLTGITSLQILDGAIGLADLDSTVNTALSLAGTVADNSITTLKIVDDTISSLDIADSAVGSSKIMDDAVTGIKVLDGTIDALDIASSAIDTGLLADGAVTSLKIFDGAITGSDIAAGAIDTLQISDDAITSLKILDGTIAGGDIADGAVDTLQLADGAVTSLKIVDGTIASSDIAAGAIDTLQLANGGVQTAKLSTASNKKTVSVQIGDAAVVLGDFERTIFVAPTNGAITKVTFTNSVNVSVGANKGVMSVERKTPTAATVAVVDLASVALTAYTPSTPALGGGTVFSTGDVYTFKWDVGIIGVALTGFLVTIEYVPSE